MQTTPRTRVKICGITRVEDALAASDAGADAIGLVFYGKSPRNVRIEQAQAIVASLPAFVTCVGLFVNAMASEVEAVLRQVGLDLLQFHGDESPAYCQGFLRPYIKALRMKVDSDPTAFGAGHAANAPQQTLGLQPRPLAGRTLGVTAVLGQEHPDVHLVGLALQPLEKALQAVPLAVPVAAPGRVAIDHPLPVSGTERLPGRIEGDIAACAELDQLLLAVLEARRLPRLDRAFAQRQPLVRNHQPEINADHPPEAATGFTGTQRRVEVKFSKNNAAVTDPAENFPLSAV